jgi:hypothetical protein
MANSVYASRKQKTSFGGSAMNCKVMMVGAVTAAALCASVGTSSALTVTPLQTIGTSAIVQKVTFWGRPFPYGYNWSVIKACTRYEPVETAHGTHMERVWVCRDRKYYR